MYIFNIARAIKNKFKDFEKYYKRIRFFEENSYYSMKHLKKNFYCNQINRKNN